MNKTWIAAALLSLATQSLAQPPAALQPLGFLVGTWDAAGGPPGASGGTTFRWELQDRVLVRTNHAEYPASQGSPAATHDDLIVVYAEGGSPVRASYYDNEGHVIRYVATTLRPGALVLVSEAAAGQPRFRLSYAAIDAGRVAGDFSIARPDAPGVFVTMFRWELVKAKP